MPRKASSGKDSSHLFDRIFKENAEQLFIPLIKDQLGLEIESYELLREKIPRTLEREVDFLYRVTHTDGRTYILHLEFQRENEKDLAYRMAEYHGFILRKYQLEVRHVVVYLGEHDTLFHTRLPTEMVYLGYEVIRLHQLDTDQLLSSQLPEVILLAVLGAYPPERAETVLRLVVHRLRETCRDETDLLKRIAQLTFLSRLRNLEEETLNVIESMPITYDLQKDKIYQRGFATGEVSGKELGIELATEAIALLRGGKTIAETAIITGLSEVAVSKLAANLK